MQNNLECFEAWNLSEAEVSALQDPKFDVKNAARHIKVIFYIFKFWSKGYYNLF